MTGENHRVAGLRVPAGYQPPAPAAPLQLVPKRLVIWSCPVSDCAFLSTMYANVVGHIARQHAKGGASAEAVPMAAPPAEAAAGGAGEDLDGR